MKTTEVKAERIKFAVQHLTTIEKMQKKLASYTNLNLHSLMGRLEEERMLLINENPAYADAAEILKLIEEAE